jgi:serine/threonine-protein kinase
MGGSREAVVKTGDVVEGRYRIIRTLGEGGMGSVFLAEHTLIKRRVAIKILHPELATDADVIERFMNEARAAGTLGHPNIVESTDMGFMQSHVPYIVFEFLEGALLTDEIYRLGGLPVRRAVRIATQIASALHAAHNAGVVHRDLKSDNVFLTDKDEAFDHVKVLDFGISRFLSVDDKQKGMVMGTPEFMAPEQITDPEHVDRRADVYALGVILYEMLTARRPFAADEDPRQLMHRIVREAPPPLLRPEVPHGLADMIMTKLLAKHPGDRFQTMSDVEAALESFITRSDGTPMPARRSQPIPMPIDDDSDITDVARHSKTMPRPTNARTPVSSRRLTPAAIDQVRLPTAPHAHKINALYAIAGLGVAVGALGIVFGLKSGKHGEVAKPVAAEQRPAVAQPVAKQVEKIAVELDADIANARITFRRRSVTAPVTMQINSTDVMEIVEVTAPGYKTARYWLTFDRPTHLHAHLAKGTGIAEATEEDTLVALGEVQAHELPGARASAAQGKQIDKPIEKPIEKTVARAKPVATPRTIAARTAMAPRKIGRAAADEAPQVAATPDVPTEAPATAEPEPTVAAPSLEATVVAEAPTPEAAKPEAVRPEATAAILPEPAKPAAAVEAVHPGIDASTTATVANGHRTEISKCFADAKKKNAGLKGTINLQLQVDAGGRVHRVQVQTNLKDPLVAACVVKSANAWRFPARANGDVTTVSYPFAVN